MKKKFLITYVKANKIANNAFDKMRGSQHVQNNNFRGSNKYKLCLIAFNPASEYVSNHEESSLSGYTVNVLNFPGKKSL